MSSHGATFAQSQSFAMLRGKDIHMRIAGLLALLLFAQTASAELLLTDFTEVDPAEFNEPYADRAWLVEFSAAPFDEGAQVAWVNLPTGELFGLDLHHRVEHPNGAVSLHGRWRPDGLRVKEAPPFSCVLTASPDRDRAAAWLLSPSHNTYELRPSPVGTLLTLVDVDRMPGCGFKKMHGAPRSLDLGISTNADSAFPDLRASSAKSGPRNEVIIDKLTVYDAPAAAAIGDIQTHGLNTVEQCNAAFRDSNVALVLNSVFIAAVPETVTENDELLLARLRFGNDGRFDQVNVWQDQYRADLVSIIAEDLPLYCGLAYYGYGDPTHCYNATQRSCISGLTFVHEVAHLFGGAHDRDNAASPGVYSYSYGYKNPGAYRSLLSYSCSSGGSCPRLPILSSPAITHLGLPAGVPLGTPEEADMATTVRNFAPIVAAFRDATGPPTQVPTGTATPMPTPTPTPTAVVTIAYEEDFLGSAPCSVATNCTDDGSCDIASTWLANATGDDGDWATLVGSTGSSGTGPDGGRGGLGDRYIYVEASSCHDNTHILETIALDLSALSEPRLRFWYHASGCNIGALDVEINTGGVWTRLPFALEIDEDWQPAEIDLTSFNGTSVQLRWVAVTGQDGGCSSDFQGDIALDDISIVEGLGLPTPPPIPTATPTPVQGTTIAEENFSGSSNCTNMWQCTADGNCDITSNLVFNASGDGGDWTVDSGSTRSPGTGPSGGHTGGSSDRYLYTEASGECQGIEHILESYPVDLSSVSSPRLEFWVHAVGCNPGTLVVEAKAPADAQWQQLLAYQNDVDLWLRLEADLTPWAGGEVVVRWRGTTGPDNFCFEDWLSDMALDDIRFYSVPATAIPTATPTFTATPTPMGTPTPGVTCTPEVLQMSGQVTDASTGQPIEGAIVETNGRTTTTDDQGFYSLFTGVFYSYCNTPIPRIDYLERALPDSVTATGYAAVTPQSYELPLGGRLTVDVALDPLLPTPTPVPAQPTSFLAGYWSTDLNRNGGTMRLLAVPSSQPAGINVLYFGAPTDLFLRDDGAQDDFAANDGVWGLSLALGGNVSPIELPLDLSVDGRGEWPWLVVQP